MSDPVREAFESGQTTAGTLPSPEAIADMLARPRTQPTRVQRARGTGLGAERVRRLPLGPERDEAVYELYRRAMPPQVEGTASDAIRRKMQTCGLLAYLLDDVPDNIACAVAEHLERTTGRPSW